ncbi:MAG: hypothetical protein KC983_06255, partial [Phycisphaerales bacterium]|nr:hypothetical protein [Phycisphaerales bacterium]
PPVYPTVHSGSIDRLTKALSSTASASGSNTTSRQRSLISRMINGPQQVELIVAVEAIVWGVFRTMDANPGMASIVYGRLMSDGINRAVGAGMMAAGILQLIAMAAGWYHVRLGLLATKTFIWAVIAILWISHAPASFAWAQYAMLVAMSSWATLLVHRPGGDG